MTYSPNNKDRLWQETREEGWFHFEGPLRFILMIIFIISAIVGTWYFLSSTEDTTRKMNIPIIKNDGKPTKIKAEDQGVPTVKHQDKLVYGRIREDKNSVTVEHILPDPEPPVTQLVDHTGPIKMVDQYQPEDLDIETVAHKSEETSPLKTIADLIEEDPTQKEIAKDEPAKEKAASTPKTARGTVFIQLGSLKSYDIAESEWDRLSKKHTDLFGSLKPTIQKVDLGAEKGIYYRLRTGPFESKEVASKACSTLKERKVECIVIQ
jgi:cell division protein FtsN